jgi:hypothetical protein
MKRSINVAALVYIFAAWALLTMYAWNAYTDGTWEPLAAWVTFWVAMWVFTGTVES